MSDSLTWPSPASTTVTLLVGATLFGVAQGWLFSQVEPVPGVEHSGWFLNSSVGVRVIGQTFLATGLAIGLFRRNGVMEAALTSVGAALAMTLVLFRLGPGSIFPIVLMFGTVVVAIATSIGTVAGVAGRRLIGATLRRLGDDG